MLYTEGAAQQRGALGVFGLYDRSLHDRSLHDQSLHDLKYIKFQIIRFRDVPEYRVVG